MSPTIVPAPLGGTRDEWPDEDFDLPEGDSILQHIQQQGLEDAGAGRVALSKPSRPTTLRMSTGPEEQDEVEDWDLEGDFPSSSAPGLGMIVAPAFNGGTVTPVGAKSEAVAASKDSEDWDLDLDAAPTIKATGIVKPAVTSTKSLCVPASPNHAENDEGNTSTIKVSKLTLPSAHIPPTTIPLPSVSRIRANNEDDMENAFALPDDLSHLSLKPLVHQPSKSAIGEWSSDTTGSMLSDVPSSFGFHDKTASESPTSLPDSGTNTDEEAEVEGLVLPDTFLPKDLARMLEKKKKGQAPLRSKAKLPFPSEDDNPESGLAIQDDSELSPSRLRRTGLSPKVRRVAKTLPSIRPSPTPPSISSLQPPSSITVTKASTHPSTLIAPKLASRDVRSPSPIFPRPASETRMVPASALASKPSKPVLPRRPKTGTLSRTKPQSPPPSNPSTPSLQPVLSHSHSMLLIPRTGPSSSQMSKFLKHQKSTSGLPTSPSSSVFTRPEDPKSPSGRGLSRQASLSSLMDSQPNLRSLNEDKHDHNDGVGSRPTSRQSTSATSGLPPLQTRGTIGHGGGMSYKQHTASSRARGLRTTESGVIGSDREKGLLHMFPARPTTPSTSASALRLTMPTTSSRAKMKEKARVPVSSIFPLSTTHSSSGSTPSSVVAPGGGASSSPSPTSRQSSLSPVQMLRPSGARSPMRMTISSAAKVIRRPKTARTYGDGTELDGIEDLVVEKEKESKYRITPRVLSSAKIPAEKRTSTVTTSRRSGASQAATPSEKRPPSSLSIGDPPRSAGVPTIARQKSKIDLGVIVSGSNTPTPRLTPAPSPGEYAATRRTRTRSATQKKPTLIRNLSGVGSPKVVGDMRWNPQSLLWEGNESALKDFESQAHPARPALITHLTGSSVGGIGSPTGFLGHNARIVGNMIFDPTKMCWINRNVEDEIDPFAGISDDEGNEATWGKNKCATITIRTYHTGAPTAGTPLETVIGSPARSSVSTNRASMAFTTTSESDTESIEAPSLVGSAEGSPPRRFGRGASAALIPDIHEALIRMSRQAEERHRKEVRGWLLSPTGQNRQAACEDDDVKVNRSYLFEIRELATRKYTS